MKIKPRIHKYCGKWWADCGAFAATGFQHTFEQACIIAKQMWEEQ